MTSNICAAIADKLDRDIAIIGKGPSVDEIDLSILSNFIVINTNDSEAIFPGDIAVFHHGWVLDRFDHAPPKCGLYVTDRDVPAGVARMQAPYVPQSPDTADFLIERFFADDMVIEQAIVISALRIADEVGRVTGRRKRVYLLGFDFTTRAGFSNRIENGAHGLDDAYVERLISDQEKLVQLLLMQRDRLSIDVFHVGSKPYSFFSGKAFNALFTSDSATSPPLAGTSRNDPDRVKVVAEITTNHFGDRTRLEAMIRSARNAGADYIKLQKRDVATFYTQEELGRAYASPYGRTFLDYRQGIELDRDDFAFVADLCRSLALGWIVSVLDRPSFEFVREFQPDLIKLPSTISEHRDFLGLVAMAYDGALVISTGYTDRSYEEFLLATFTRASRIYLLQCTSAYPAPQDHAQIGVVRHYYNLGKADPRIVAGYSSHDIGSLCSMMAVAAGARMIEKHVKLGEVSWSHFDHVAVDLAGDDFSRYVADIRQAERIVGSEAKCVQSSEHHKYRVRNP